MKNDLLKIINNYEVIPQLKYFQSEVFELNEAIINAENYNPNSQDTLYKINSNIQENVKHIAEEIADVMVMLKQFQYYYGIEDKEIEEVMKYKIERQLKRIENENKSNNN